MTRSLSKLFGLLLALISAPALSQMTPYPPPPKPVFIGPYLGGGIGYVQAKKGCLGILSGGGRACDDNDMAWGGYAGYRLFRFAAAEVAYHLRENLAAQVGVWYFPVSVQSALSEELLTKGRVAPESAEAFLLRYAALAGLEMMPVYGKLNVFDGKILRLGMYLNAGLGAAKTRVQLRPSSDPSTGRTFGDTGFRPIASLGLGLRVFLGEQLTVRVELRDFAYSGYVSRVNGCSAADANAIKPMRRRSRSRKRTARPRRAFPPAATSAPSERRGPRRSSMPAPRKTSSPGPRPT